LALLNENGTVVNLKKDWLGDGKKQFTAVYSEFAPSKKSKVTVTVRKHLPYVILNFNHLGRKRIFKD
jgi:hypothetical protein